MSFPVFSSRGAVPFLLLGFFLAAFAQDDLFITVSTPSGDAGGLSTVSSPAAPQPAPVAKPDKKTAAQPASAIPKTETVEKWERDLLRDPFWPVGFFPEGWQKKQSAQGSDSDESGWKAAAGRIRISGTSRMGGRTAAIINGELKNTGDQVEVVQGGITYQWQILGIDANGQVQLKKLGTR